MKLPLKSTYKITILSCLFLLAACGSKTNQVNPNAPGGVTGTSPLYASNPQIATQIQNVKASVTCLPGLNRLTTDAYFNVSGGAMSGTTIGGSWQPGLMTAGTISNLYVGVSAWRDLMFLTKVSNGGQVIGYNVTLSYCEVPNKIAGYPLLVSSDRPLVQFQAPQGITINTATPCGYGLIAAASNTVILSQKSGNPLTFDFPVYTSFASPSCQ